MKTCFVDFVCEFLLRDGCLLSSVVNVLPATLFLFSPCFKVQHWDGDDFRAGGDFVHSCLSSGKILYNGLF